MANTRQHQVHEQKLEQLVKSMPFYIVEYVDNKLDTRSPSTLCITFLIINYFWSG
ncbi:hypothetical protein ABKP09_04715 [Peribacillus frigoritolerans]|uniref:hypothetical protein n=1 Tax=Peribacillus frigoritolerans TaxID=450367 RepID=UPI0032B4848F